MAPYHIVMLLCVPSVPLVAPNRTVHICNKMCNNKICSRHSKLKPLVELVFLYQATNTKQIILPCYQTHYSLLDFVFCHPNNSIIKSAA